MQRRDFYVDDQRSFRGRGTRIVLRKFQTDSGAHTTAYSVRTGSCLSGGKATEAWSWLLASSADVKNEWNYASAPPYAFMPHTQAT
jgi:hypothetical protein